MKIYTGIGSRATPKEVLSFMENVGEALGGLGYTLRSGGAEGADTAFEVGAKRVSKPKMEIFLPWDGFEGHKADKNHLLITDEEVIMEAWDIASEIHPAWNKCSAGAQNMHVRNCFQILGRDLKSPTKFVVFWAPEDSKGKVDGGTATAVNLARQREIPTFNLLLPAHLKRVSKLLEK